jgi:hypothetical protein
LWNGNIDRKAYKKLYSFFIKLLAEAVQPNFLPFIFSSYWWEPYSHSFIKVLPEAVQPFCLSQAIAGSRLTIVTQAINREPYNRVYYSQAIYREPSNRLLSIVCIR